MADKVLILCAHPDDEIIGVGGTIAKYAQEGKTVSAIIYSHGEGSHPWMQKKYTVETRIKESTKAGDIVGLKNTEFLGLKDMSLKQEVMDPKVLKLIETKIKKYKPDRIFTHSGDDVVYPDHKAVHQSVMTILEKIKYKGELFTFNIWGKDVRVSKNPKLYIDISKTFNLKVKALKEFKSQKIVMWQLIPAVYWRGLKSGLENKCRYAEKFVKIK